MKKFVLLLATVLIVSVTFADNNPTITPEGWCNGRYYFSASGFSDDDGNQININGIAYGHFGTDPGKKDTAFHVKSSSFAFSIPQPNQNTPNTFTLSANHEVNFNNQLTGTNAGGPCILMPVKWAGFSLQHSIEDSTLVTISWQTMTESNIKAYTLQASSNGLTWDAVQSIAPNNGGNSPTAQNYTITYSDPLIAVIVEAGFGLIGSILIIGLIVGFVSKKHKVIGIACAVMLVFCMVACSKSNIHAQPKVLKYRYFRVIETDLDGNVTYGIVLHC